VGDVIDDAGLVEVNEVKTGDDRVGPDPYLLAELKSKRIPVKVWLP
jgi:hypothetical protein